jgi:hypothetical protein
MITNELNFREILPGIIAGIRDNNTDSGYALPDATLDCLGELVRQCGLRKVFEFGSGRSTKKFLEWGCSVFSLEDSRHWLEQTLATIPPEQLPRLRTAVQPLQTVWHRGVPMRGWEPGEFMAELQEAELVLIDSPALPPFREHPLILSLNHATKAIIIIDDANIPTVRRYCERLAGDRARVLSLFTPKDHGLYFFARKTAGETVDDRRGGIETVKAWRRFLLASPLPA